jgi:membrane associated rhomboid family serine protease
MRDDYARPSKNFDALKVILISLVGIFLLQKIVDVWINAGFMTTWFGLTVPGMQRGQIYTLLSYGYLHDTSTLIPWHLLLNLFIIYFIGKHIQMQFGAQRLFELYHLCILCGGLLWLLFAFPRQSHSPYPLGVVGASGAGYGLLALICLLKWQERMTVHLYLLIPVTFTGKVGFFVILGIQAFFFVFGELPGAGGSAAYSAHLGGIGAAVLYHRFLLSRPTLMSRFERDSKPSKPKSRTTQPSTGRFTLNIGGKKDTEAAPASPLDTGALRSEVDRILDKINAKGFGSLTDEEKRTLDQAKDRLK